MKSLKTKNLKVIQKLIVFVLIQAFVSLDMAEAGNIQFLNNSQKAEFSALAPVVNINASEFQRFFQAVNLPVNQNFNNPISKEEDIGLPARSDQASILLAILKGIHPELKQDINILITMNCPLNCKHCLAGSIMESFKGRYIEKNRLLNWLDQLTGFPNVFFVGGEPFYYPDFIEIVNYAAKRVKTVNIDTNGLAVPQDEKKAEEFFRRFPKNINFYLSVDEFHAAELKKHNRDIREIIKILEKYSLLFGFGVKYNIRFEGEGDRNAELKQILNTYGLSEIYQRRQRDFFINSLFEQGEAVEMVDLPQRTFAVRVDDVLEHNYSPNNYFLFINLQGKLVTSDHVAFLPKQPKESILGDLNQESLAQIILENILGRIYKFQKFPQLRYLIYMDFARRIKDEQLFRFYWQKAKQLNTPHSPLSWAIEYLSKELEGQPSVDAEVKVDTTAKIQGLMAEGNWHFLYKLLRAAKTYTNIFKETKEDYIQRILDMLKQTQGSVNWDLDIQPHIIKEIIKQYPKAEESILNLADGFFDNLIRGKLADVAHKLDSYQVIINYKGFIGFNKNKIRQKDIEKLTGYSKGDRTALGYFYGDIKYLTALDYFVVIEQLFPIDLSKIFYQRLLKRIMGLSVKDMLTRRIEIFVKERLEIMDKEFVNLLPFNNGLDSYEEFKVRVGYEEIVELPELVINLLQHPDKSVRIKVLKRLDAATITYYKNLPQTFKIWKTVLGIATNPNTETDELEAALAVISRSFYSESMSPFFALETFLELLICGDERISLTAIKLLKDFRTNYNLSNNFYEPHYNLRCFLNDTIDSFEGQGERIFKDFLFPGTDISEAGPFFQLIRQNRDKFKNYLEARIEWAIELIEKSPTGIEIVRLDTGTILSKKEAKKAIQERRLRIASIGDIEGYKNKAYFEKYKTPIRKITLIENISPFLAPLPKVDYSVIDLGKENLEKNEKIELIEEAI